MRSRTPSATLCSEPQIWATSAPISPIATRDGRARSSLLFLEHVRGLLAERHLRIEHIDAIVIVERPKLGPHFPAMRDALAGALGVEHREHQPEGENE